VRAVTRKSALRGARATLPDPAQTTWTDLEKIARSTMVARDGGRRIVTRGAWSAAHVGEHTIDIHFHAPVTLRRLRVVCEDIEVARTQELTVWATLRRGERHKEVVRETCTFSPTGATREVTDHACMLEEVSALQLRIVPDVNGRPRVALISSLQLVAD
jgi:hypothetical protein